MDKFATFLSNHYLLLDLISLFLIFALAGYFVEKKRKKESPFKIAQDKYKQEKVNLNQMQNQVSNNVSLSEFVNQNASVKNENNNNMNNVNNINNNGL